MLRIVLELDHVEVAVASAHQVRLRSPAHPSHVLDGLRGHRWSIVQRRRAVRRSGWPTAISSGRFCNGFHYKERQSNQDLEDRKVPPAYSRADENARSFTAVDWMTTTAP